jgi:hypothetical protein
MKRLLTVLIALVVVFTLVLPASAADLKFGGMFWTTWYSTENMKDGSSDTNDKLTNFWYTRMRMYFTAIASENLMAVSKVEVDANWGDGRIGKVSIDGGSDGRADGDAFLSDGNKNASANSGFEIKNAYIDFTIPDTALNFKVGLIGAKLGKSGIIFNDDTPGVMASYSFAPFSLALLYSKLNDNATIYGTGVTAMTGNATSDDWNLFAFDFTYQQEAIRASLDFAWAHTGDYKRSVADPTCGLGVPLSDLDSGLPDESICDLLGDPSLIDVDADPVDCLLCDAKTLESSNAAVDHFNLGGDFDYTGDMFSVYFTGAVNFGKIEDNAVNALGQLEDSDFKGWMVTAGGDYSLSDIIMLGLDFYYASGQKADDDDIKSYETYGVVGRPSYYMDDIVFPGWFDYETATISTAAGGGAKTNNITSTGLTATNANYVINNIWAIGLHANLKPFEGTLLQPGFSYMRFVEDVVEDVDPLTGQNNTGKDLGLSLYLRANQGITDGLALKATFSYLFPGDAYSPSKDDDDAYKIAAGLFWSW